jgi:hypothetical protein
MKKILKNLLLYIKNILFLIIGCTINLIITPIAILFLLIKHINKVSIGMDRHLTNFKLRGKVRKKDKRK